MAGERSQASIVWLANESDCDHELIKQNQRGKIAQASQKMLNFYLAFLSIDAFQSHIRPDGDSQIQQAQRPQQHRLLRLWSRVFHPICVYLIARPLLTYSLRFLINYLTSSRNSRLPTQFWVLRALRWLLDFNGDPSCSVDNLTPVAYLAHPIFITMFCIALPYYLRNIRLFDCSVVRFLLDPKREIHRLSGSTRKKLNSALQRVEQQRRELSSLLGIRPRFRAPHLQCMNLYDGEQLQATLVRLMAQSNLLRRFIQNSKKIRPPIFRAEWLQLYYQIFVVCFIAPIIINFTIFSLIIIFITLINWQARCKELQWPTRTDLGDCTFLSQFRLVEFLALAEICLSYGVFVVISFSLLLSLISIICFNQIIMTYCLSGSLSRLLADLRQMGRQSEQVQRGQSKQVREKTTELIELESIMYENIIGLWTYEVESRANVAQLGIVMTFYICMVALQTLVSFGAYLPSVSASSVGCTASGHNSERRPNFVDEHMSLVVTFVPSIAWSFANFWVLICAIISSRVVRMKRLVVSILAQTVEIQHIQRSIVAKQLSSLELHDGKQEMEANDPLLLLLRKIVISPSFTEDYHSVNILNSKITYGKVLELNFYVIALISLLSARR